MADKNYISIKGDGNISLQDVTGRDININDVNAMQKVFEETKPEYIQDLFQQIDENYQELLSKNKEQTQKIIALLQREMKNRNISVKESKNILTGTISGVGGNVHIGDIIYSDNKNNSISKYISVFVFLLLLILAFLYFKEDLFNSEITEKQETLLLDTTKSELKTDSLQAKGLNTSLKEENTIEETSTEVNTILNLKLWTSKGVKPTFIEDEDVKLYFQANKECYVRIIYKMADGTAVLLADNLKVEKKDLNKQLSPPTDFVCAEPFGEETLTAYAQQKPFEKIQTQNMDGYDIILSLNSAYQLSEKGLKKKIQFTKKVIKVITKEL